MSNYTEGKKALSAGDFETAQKKLIKSLDNRPNEGETWWCLMLCQEGMRSDDELASSLRAAFTDAAKSGARPPETPFTGRACQNALKFGSNGRRRAYVEKLTAELSDIWKQYRGKPLGSLGVKKQKPSASVGKYFIYATYGAITLALVAAALIFMGLFRSVKPFTVVGYILCPLFVIAALLLRGAGKKRGEKASGTLALILTVLLIIGLSLVIAGMAAGSRITIIIAGALITAVAIVASYNLAFKTRLKTKQVASRAKNTRASRDPSVLINAQSEKKEKSNEYKDEFD